MEAIITIVGFLGAGKTTLLRHLISKSIDSGWKPFIILNDYENANLDARQFTDKIDPVYIRALTGSCICCSGINELRNYVNRIPERPNGIAFIEANGTSDSSALMEFLGVGVDPRFLPPIQVSVVDVKNWQKRGVHNELESNQVQVSSLMVLTHTKYISESRKAEVIEELIEINPLAEILNMDAIDVSFLPKLLPSKNEAKKMDHHKSHWSSCSVDLPDLPHLDSIYALCRSLPNTILRVKGCTKIGEEQRYTYFERTPDGKVFIRPFNGIPITGPKLLAIGPSSEPSLLNKAIDESLISY
jgi:G3E family GTPase